MRPKSARACALVVFIGVAACRDNAGGGTGGTSTESGGGTESGGSDSDTASSTSGATGFTSGTGGGSGGDLPEDPDGVSPAGTVTSVEIGPLPGNGMVAPAWDDQSTQIGGGARAPRKLHTAPDRAVSGVG